jgi:hypothetical protein
MQGKARLLRGELGSDWARCSGITVTSPSPATELCRRLVAAGHHPDVRLELFRGAVLALRIRSIGAAAKLLPMGTGFTAWQPGRGPGKKRNAA